MKIGALYPSPEEKGSTANRDNEKTRVNELGRNSHSKIAKGNLVGDG